MGNRLPDGVSCQQRGLPGAVPCWGLLWELGTGDCQVRLIWKGERTNHLQVECGGGGALPPAPGEQLPHPHSRASQA